MTHLGADANRVRIITLAAPFLRVFVRRPLEVPVLLQILLFIAVLVILVIFFLLLTGAVMNTLTDIKPSAVSSTSLLYVGLATALVAVVVSYFVMRWLTSIFVNGWGDRPLKIERAVAHGTLSTLAPRMLILRAVDDEAALFLATGAIGSRLSQLVLLDAIHWLYFGGIVLTLTLFWAVLGTGVAIWLVGTFGVVCYLGALAFFVSPGLFKSAFGKEFVIGAMRCDIAADSVPDTSERIAAITLAPAVAGSPIQDAPVGAEAKTSPQAGKIESSARLRHGLYNHPQCVSEIVGWLGRTN